MGMIQRVSDILKANINRMLDQAEDPEAVLDQLIQEMQETYRKAKIDVAKALADEKRLKHLMQTNQEMAQKWGRKAMLAVEKNDDDLAREALKRKRSYEDIGREFESQWNEQKKVTDILRENLFGLESKIDEARRKKSLLVARQKRAMAQKKLQDTLEQATSEQTYLTIGRFEEKITEIEARAEAEIDLIDGELDGRFRELEQSGGDNVEDELEALKTQVGGRKAGEQKLLSTEADEGGATPQAESAVDADAGDVPVAGGGPEIRGDQVEPSTPLGSKGEHEPPRPAAGAETGEKAASDPGQGAPPPGVPPPGATASGQSVARAAVDADNAESGAPAAPAQAARSWFKARRRAEAAEALANVLREIELGVEGRAEPSSHAGRRPTAVAPTMELPAAGRIRAAASASPAAAIGPSARPATSAQAPTPGVPPPARERAADARGAAVAGAAGAAPKAGERNADLERDAKAGTPVAGPVDKAPQVGPADRDEQAGPANRVSDASAGDRRQPTGDETALPRGVVQTAEPSDPDPAKEPERERVEGAI